MAVYTRRVQTALSEEQYKALTRLSEGSGKSLSTLIREAVERVYFRPVDLKRRLAALESLLSLEAPVSDWEQMETEIIRGALNG